jgi:hypothetical protein
VGVLVGGRRERRIMREEGEFAISLAHLSPHHTCTQTHTHPPTHHVMNPSADRFREKERERGGRDRGEERERRERGREIEGCCLLLQDLIQRCARVGGGG